VISQMCVCCACKVERCRAYIFLQHLTSGSGSVWSVEHKNP
jgi:hypothetical protein